MELGLLGWGIGVAVESLQIRLEKMNEYPWQHHFAYFCSFFENKLRFDMPLGEVGCIAIWCSPPCQVTKKLSTPILRLPLSNDLKHRQIHHSNSV